MQPCQDRRTGTPIGDRAHWTGKLALKHGLVPLAGMRHDPCPTGFRCLFRTISQQAILNGFSLKRWRRCGYFASGHEIFRFSCLFGREASVKDLARVL
jgi:hypothetical protein